MRRARTPAVLQLEVAECGAASLSIILAYHGRIEQLATLRRECGVSRDGSNAANVVKAARRYGMQAKGFAKDIPALQVVKPPYIVFWNFDHFLVVEGFGKSGVFLNDPATGHRTVTLDEFEKSYTGVTLVLEPGPEFTKGGRAPSMAKAVAARITGAFGAIAYCVLAGLLLVLPGLAVAGFHQVFLDGVLLEHRVDWLRPLILAMLIALLVQAALMYLQLKYLRRLKIMLSIKLSSRFMWHMLQLPAVFYAQRFAGEVANRGRLNDKLAGALSGKLTRACIDVIMMTFYAVMMYYYDAVLTSVGIGVAVINILVLRWMSRRRVEANMRVLQDYGKADGTALAGLQSMETLKSAGLEPKFFAKWSGHYAKATNARQDLEVSNQMLSVLPSLLTSIAMTLLLIVGGYRIIHGHLTIGMLVALQSLMRSFLSPITNLVNLGGLVQELQGDLQRVDDVLAHPVDEPPKASEREATGDHKIIRLKGYVELSGVTFGYSPLEEPLIRGFDLSIRPGERIALVGRSGSGKSTLLKLIGGELKPWEGRILFDGRNRDEIPLDVLVNSFSIVEQDIFLFGGAVRENLTLWDSTVPDPNLARACEDAVIRDDVLELPGGYDGTLLEGGSNLSGGQRQRLEIARALVNDPSILVLDEATSALDAETERLVLERLRMRGCSTIIVSHRLSAIRDCDRIIVMEQGRIVEQGSHEELWGAGDRYVELLRSEDGLADEVTAC